MDDALTVRLAKAAETFSVFLSMIEAHRECSDDAPFEDKDVVLHFMGSGASHFVTIGDFRRLREVLCEIPRETGDAGPGIQSPTRAAR